jgi:predicted Ser/Thr protein kinase
MIEQISHYRILKKIGEGGMGEVFCAQDTKLGRTVALKILPAELAEDSKRLQRFLREARVASTLSHPNVTHIYEVGEDQGIHFISMEYVEGETLQEKMRQGQMDSDAILRIAFQMAEALQTAHSLGIVDRDIKPANVMLDAKNNVKILDFGLAKQDWVVRPDIDQLSTEAHTQVGTLLGTVQYMSPEQALGKNVDHRSDIFSFGVVLYELGTGRRPFSGPNATATIAQILTIEPDSPARINSKLPLELNHLIEKCLRKNAEDRYQSLSDLLVDLHRFKEGAGGNVLRRPVLETEYRIPRKVARICFIALQCMYLIFYICALRWSESMEASLGDLFGPPVASKLTLVFIVTAVLGMAIRLHILFLVAWDHVASGVQFRKMFPLFFALDAFWALAPFGLLRKAPGIFLIACVPPLVFSPISQRTLIRSAYDLYEPKRTSIET